MALSIPVSRGEVRLEGGRVVAEQRRFFQEEVTKIPIESVTSVELSHKGPWPLLLLGAYIAVSGVVGGFWFEAPNRGIIATSLGALLIIAYWGLRKHTVKVSSPTGEIEGRSQNRKDLERFAARLEARMDGGRVAARDAAARVKDRVGKPPESQA